MPLNSEMQALDPRKFSKLLNVEFARTKIPAEACFSVSPYSAVVRLKTLQKQPPKKNIFN